MNKIDIPINSERENVPEIQSLTVRANELQNAFDFWNTGYVWLVGFTVFFAIVVFFTQFMSIRKGKELVNAQSELLRAKDEQLAKDLQGKEIKITEAKTAAATAHERAAEAEARAAEANEGLAKAHENTETLRKQNLELESKVEKERSNRLEMETVIAPRTIEQRQTAKQLERFSGISVIVESLAESEPWRTAGQIAWTVNNAKWNVLPGMQRYLDATGFFDGVAIEANVGPRPQEDHSSEAADALVEVLTKNNIQANRRPAINLPLNTIRIRVGLKPAGYFQRNRKDLEYGNMLYK